MKNKLIELKDLTKNFDDQQVLRGINLDIYENEFMTLFGAKRLRKDYDAPDHSRI